MTTTPESPGTPATATPPFPTSQPVLLKALRWGIPGTVGLAIIALVIAWFSGEGTPTIIGAPVGVLIGGTMLVLTAGSIALANRSIGSPNYVIVFFATVLGGWILKFVAFIVVALLLRDQPWLNPVALFVGLIVGVLFTVVIDVLVIARSRIPLQVSGV